VGQGDRRADEFTAEVVDEDGRPVVRVRGEIDSATAERFRACLVAALERDSHLVIDLSGSTFMDSTGLSALVRAYHENGRLKEAVVLRSVAPTIRRTLEISGVSELVTVVP
jgi:anti-anti-sigma factor